jgi:hypothetical protein
MHLTAKGANSFVRAFDDQTMQVIDSHCPIASILREAAAYPNFDRGLFVGPGTMPIALLSTSEHPAYDLACPTCQIFCSCRGEVPARTGLEVNDVEQRTPPSVEAGQDAVRGLSGAESPIQLSR